MVELSATPVVEVEVVDICLRSRLLHQHHRVLADMGERCPPEDGPTTEPPFRPSPSDGGRESGLPEVA